MRRIYLDRGEGFVYRWANSGKKAITMHSNTGILEQGENNLLQTDTKFELVSGREPDIPNTAVIKASCGQAVTLNLDGIDKSQPINEVTIRGVKYTPQ